MWLKEQKETWSNDWYLRRWLWFQEEHGDWLKRSRKEIGDIFSEKK